jgi:hypothetical protein
MPKFLFMLILLVLPQLTSAKPEIQRSWLPQYSEIGLVLNNAHMRKVQTDEEGSLNTFRPKLNIQGALNWPLIKALSLSTELHLGLPQKGRDENIKKINWSLLFPLVFTLPNERFRLRSGAGLSFLRIWGPGGTARLDNGIGSDNFFLPSEAQTTMNTLWFIGAEFLWSPEWSARLDAQVFNLTDSVSRSFSTLLSVHYHFEINLGRQ